MVTRVYVAAPAAATPLSLFFDLRFFAHETQTCKAQIKLACDFSQCIQLLASRFERGGYPPPSLCYCFLRCQVSIARISSATQILYMKVLMYKLCYEYCFVFCTCLGSAVECGDIADLASEKCSGTCKCIFDEQFLQN